MSFFFLNKMDNETDNNDSKEEFESKFVSDIDCISHVEIKEEIFIPENTSDGESTLSDNEKNPDSKLEECPICCKYRSMFIILKNHECQYETDRECRFCLEISHWSDCFKSHRDSHLIEKESDHSSDSTASDREEIEGKCEICLKYEFMLPLLKSHICQLRVDSKCPECSEVLHWMTCYKKHVDSHKVKDMPVLIKEENSSDSTVSDNEEIQKLLSPFENVQNGKCQVCLKYQGMFIILEDDHKCYVKMPDKNCERCSEIIQWYSCFDKHLKTHQNKECNMLDNCESSGNFFHFGRKFDCGICLKLNSIVTHLVKNHKCIDNKECPVCQEVSYWLSCLKNHKQSEVISDLSYNEELEAFKRLGQHADCAVCSKFRIAIVNLCDHACSKKKGRQKCEICLEVSFWFKNFRLHEKHHTIDVSPLKNFFSCSTCGKRFSGEKMLNIHKSYCKSSSFTCDICNKKFINMFFLKKHNIFHLCNSSKLKLQYKCKICEKMFTNSSDCKNHEDFHELEFLKCTKHLNEVKSEIH